jgi:hypothetical protein
MGGPDNQALHRDLVNMMCGERLGSGIGREVFVNSLDKTQVIKFEGNACSFQNVIEWETWKRVVGTEFERWFAPCISISPNGSVLIQARTTVPTKFPDQMPVFLTDFKRANYGVYKGRVVAHDYGTNLLMERGMSKRMRKPYWWDLGDSE